MTNFPCSFWKKKNAKIVVKTPTGISKRETINIVMQATVWGSLFCTASMDKLRKLMYENEEPLYKYKGVIDVPILGMVDDIMSIQKCSVKAVEAIAVVDSIIEMKKLSVSERRCKRIHISKKKDNDRNCPELKVHHKNMANANQEKYLGDIVNSTVKIKHTIEDRKNRACAIAADILAIIVDVPLGKYKI